MRCVLIPGDNPENIILPRAIFECIGFPTGTAVDITWDGQNSHRASQHKSETEVCLGASSRV